MGQRANLIILEGGEYSLRYDHWAANRLDDILFWGADYALRYCAAQEEVGEEGWLDEVWAEGGAVLDLDKKHLLWFGGDDLMFEVPLRRVFLQLQRNVWRDWTVEWAHRGIVDLAEYVGYPREKVLASGKNTRSNVELRLPEGKTWLRTLGSIETAEGETKIFPLFEEVEDFLRNGVVLVAQCRNAKTLKSLVWQDWEEQGDFPEGGFHLSEKNKTVQFWWVRDCPNTVRELKNLWEGWAVVWHQDEYEFQTEILKGKVILPEIDEPVLVKKLHESLVREDGKSGIESFREVQGILEEKGRKVQQVNPWAFKSQKVENPLATKKQIWRRIFGEE